MCSKSKYSINDNHDEYIMIAKKSIAKQYTKLENKNIQKWGFERDWLAFTDRLYYDNSRCTVHSTSKRYTCLPWVRYKCNDNTCDIYWEVAEFLHPLSERHNFSHTWFTGMAWLWKEQQLWCYEVNTFFYRIISDKTRSTEPACETQQHRAL